MPVQKLRVRPDALPPFSPVVSRLLRLISDDNANLREAAGLISSDASLAAQVLRLANSPLFGLQREVTSLLVALTLLGTGRIYSIALTAGLKRLARRVALWPAARRCWEHSLATAFLAADVSLEQFRDMSEDYTAGLLHDIGRLILLANAPAQYSELLQEAAGRQVDSRELERNAFGASHEDIGAEFMRRYNFPESLVMVTLYHHHPADAPVYRETVELIGSCSRTAQLCGYWVIPPASTSAPEDDLCLYLRERMLEVDRQLAGQ